MLKNIQEFLSVSEEVKEDVAKSQPPANHFVSDEMIFEAVELGDFEAIKKLVDSHDALHITNEQGWTLLHAAAYKGHQEIVCWLLERGLSPFAVTTRTQWTSLHCAAYKGHKPVASLLLSYQAPLEAADKDGWTPLHCAAYKGHERLIKLLLKQGASPEAKNQDGLTPRELAIQHNKMEIAEFIVIEYNLLSSSLKKQLVEQAAEINALKELTRQQQHTINRQAHVLKKLSQKQRNNERKIKWLEEVGLRKSDNQTMKKAKKLEVLAYNSAPLTQGIGPTKARVLIHVGLFQESKVNNQSNKEDEGIQIISPLVNT